jgi:hypothetical protein
MSCCSNRFTSRDANGQALAYVSCEEEPGPTRRWSGCSPAMRPGTLRAIASIAVVATPRDAIDIGLAYSVERAAAAAKSA